MSFLEMFVAYLLAWHLQVRLLGEKVQQSLVLSQTQKFCWDLIHIVETVASLKHSV